MCCNEFISIISICTVCEWGSSKNDRRRFTYGATGLGKLWCLKVFHPLLCTTTVTQPMHIEYLYLSSGWRGNKFASKEIGSATTCWRLCRFLLSCAQSQRNDRVIINCHPWRMSPGSPGSSAIWISRAYYAFDRECSSGATTAQWYREDISSRITVIIICDAFRSVSGDSQELPRLCNV